MKVRIIVASKKLVKEKKSKDRRKDFRFEFYSPDFNPIPLKELKVGENQLSIKRAAVQNFSRKGLKLILYPYFGRNRLKPPRSLLVNIKPNADVDLILSLPEKNLETPCSGKIQWVECKNEFYIAFGLFIKMSEKGIRNEVLDWLYSEWKKKRGNKP
ncbi:PilZ domain-containing protein [Acidobacteriota bacterium]